MLRFPPRVVSTLCVFQAAALIIGYMLTRSMHKVYAIRLDTESVQSFPTLAWFTRQMLSAGPWFLFVPLLWGMTATLTANLDGGIAEISSKQTKIGYVLSLVLLVFSVFSAFQMFAIAFSVGKLHPIPGSQ